jgi:hypothetical protein
MRNTRSLELITVNTGVKVLTHSADIESQLVDMLKKHVMSGGKPLFNGFSTSIKLDQGAAVFQINHPKGDLVEAYLLWDYQKGDQVWKAATERFTSAYRGSVLPHIQKPQGGSWLAAVLLPAHLNPHHHESLDIHISNWVWHLAWAILDYVQEKENSECGDGKNLQFSPLLQTPNRVEVSGSPTHPMKLEKETNFDSFPTLMAGILNTTQLLQKQGDSIYSGTYSENFGECAFEFRTMKGQWLLRKAPLDCSANIKNLLRQLAPQKLRALGTEYNPYFLLEAHLVPGFLKLCWAYASLLINPATTK